MSAKNRHANFYLFSLIDMKQRWNCSLLTNIFVLVCLILAFTFKWKHLLSIYKQLYNITIYSIELYVCFDPCYQNYRVAITIDIINLSRTTLSTITRSSKHYKENSKLYYSKIFEFFREYLANVSKSLKPM